MNKTGRNDPCPCGSGKKYKQCCQVKLAGEGMPIASNAGIFISQTLQAGVQHHQAGNLAQAAMLYRQVLQVAPQEPDALHLLGLIAHRDGNHALAIDLIGQAIQSDPSSAMFCNLGLALQATGDLSAACECYQKALLLQPDFAEAYYNLGNALKELGQPEAAIASYRQALAIAPLFAAAYSNMGTIFQEQGKLDAAAEHFRQALAIKPDLSTAHFNLGNVLKDQGKLYAAIDCYRQALVLRPDYAEARNNLGYALKGIGQIGAAVEEYQKALVLNPSFANACLNLGNALSDQGRFSEAIANYQKALALKPDYVDAHSNLLFCLNYHPDMSAEAIFAEYGRWNERHAQPLFAHADRHTNDWDPARRLRIGYVSPDFKRHSARHFVAPLLVRHDRAQVEVFAYAEVMLEDDVSAAFKGDVDHWRNTTGLDDEQMAALIRQDRIDILVDLAGHSAHNRLPVFARKPAPVQTSWLGYGYTTGLGAIDYFLADRELAPAGSESLFSEELVRLPIWTSYRPAEGMGDPGPSPVLRNGEITFGSLSRSIRINHRVIRVWAAILHRVPGSCLIINSGDFRCAGMRARMEEQFAVHGIDANRLALGCDSPPWDILRKIDISLDCFPHNSGTTLFESLYMGVPFVTLTERPSVGRMGAAILKGAGHAEWIATTEAEYVDKATSLAADHGRLSALRAGLRSELSTSPLMDEVAFARSVESAYRIMWQRRCMDRRADER